jgi:hypothetical protein
MKTLYAATGKYDLTFYAVSDVYCDVYYGEVGKHRSTIVYCLQPWAATFNTRRLVYNGIQYTLV